MEGIFPQFSRLERPWYDLWVTYAGVLHALGEHERELEIARDGRGKLPSSLPLMQAEGRALAALGRSQECDVLVDEIRHQPMRPGAHPGLALEVVAQELRAHELAAAARDALDRALAWHVEQPKEFREAGGARDPGATPL